MLMYFKKSESLKCYNICFRLRFNLNHQNQQKAFLHPFYWIKNSMDKLTEIRPDDENFVILNILFNMIVKKSGKNWAKVNENPDW